jgi:hypothetical protein
MTTVAPDRPSWFFLVAIAAASCGTEPRIAAENPHLGDGETAARSLVAGTALFVVGNTALGAADSAVRTRLAALGLTVQVKSASASTPADAAGKALIVISSTVSSSPFGVTSHPPLRARSPSEPPPRR